MNTCFIGLRPLYIFNFWLKTAESDVCRYQILTSKIGSRTERVNTGAAYPSKHETLTQCCFIVWPTSMTNQAKVCICDTDKPASPPWKWTFYWLSILQYSHAKITVGILKVKIFQSTLTSWLNYTFINYLYFFAQLYSRFCLFSFLFELRSNLWSHRTS